MEWGVCRWGGGVFRETRGLNKMEDTLYIGDNAQRGCDQNCCDIKETKT